MRRICEYPACDGLRHTPGYYFSKSPMIALQNSSRSSNDGRSRSIKVVERICSTSGNNGELDFYP